MEKASLIASVRRTHRGNFIIRTIKYGHCRTTLRLDRYSSTYDAGFKRVENLVYYLKGGLRFSEARRERIKREMKDRSVASVVRRILLINSEGKL